jgi:hypothetical protein
MLTVSSSRAVPFTPIVSVAFNLFFKEVAPERHVNQPGKKKIIKNYQTPDIYLG